VALAGNEIFWLTFAVQPAIDKVSLYNLSALPSGNWEMKSGSGGKMCGKRRLNKQLLPLLLLLLHLPLGKTVVIYESFPGKAVCSRFGSVGFSYFHYFEKEQINRTKFPKKEELNVCGPRFCFIFWWSANAITRTLHPSFAMSKKLLWLKFK